MHWLHVQLTCDTIRHVFCPSMCPYPIMDTEHKILMDAGGLKVSLFHIVSLSHASGPNEKKSKRKQTVMVCGFVFT